MTANATFLRKPRSLGIKEFDDLGDTASEPIQSCHDLVAGQPDIRLLNVTCAEILV
jgi:hypothetical protein